MEHRIGIGILIGLTMAIAGIGFSSNKFNDTQKIIFGILIFFPPLQWALMIAFLLYNGQKLKVSKEGKEERVKVDKIINLNSSLKNLKGLKEKSILSEDEYLKKVEKINNEKLAVTTSLTEEFKQLNSLKEAGVLTTEEFNKKVMSLKNDSDVYKVFKKLNAEYKYDNIIPLSIDVKQGVLKIYTRRKNGYKYGDFVSINGGPASDGKYSTNGLFGKTYIVENSRLKSIL
jgi:hypothetical protein